MMEYSLFLHMVAVVVTILEDSLLFDAYYYVFFVVNSLAVFKIHSVSACLLKEVESTPNQVF
jgi:type IV secretory pathway VirB3-like protein